MKQRLRIIITAFSISFVFMVGLSFFSMQRFSTLTHYTNKVNHSQLVIDRLYKIEGLVRDFDRAERGYMLTRDTIYRAGIFKTVDSVYPNLQGLKDLQTDTAQQQNIIILKSIIALRVATIRQNLAYMDTAHTAALSPFYYEGRKIMQDAMRKLREVHAIENKQRSMVYNQLQFYQKLTSSTLTYLLLIFFIVTTILFALMISELRKRVAYQDDLQASILDLKRSHSELEQIAYAASHDLQEPLRKIQVFGNRLLWVKKDNIDAETLNMVTRINISAERMHELIDDLVSLTSLTKQEGKEKINLSKSLKTVTTDLQQKIDNANATINSGVLPEISGYADQIQVLLKSLLDNSLKFIRHDTTPVITITSDTVHGDELIDINKKLRHKKFHRITISDNGIGFDNKFTDKMFQIFQRLHNQHSQYDGKGIGLAICQRVMANHKGYIIAYGHVEVGATFKLFFPIEN
jgi:signal transduction histidine kinase